MAAVRLVQPLWVVILAGIAWLGILFGFGYLILRGIRWFDALALRALSRALEGLAIYPDPRPGTVEVRFHTYSGALAFAVQRESRFHAPPADAGKALARLHRYNLTWGMFSLGVLFIPLLSWGNYVVQKRSIARQAAAMENLH